MLNLGQKEATLSLSWEQKIYVYYCLASKVAAANLFVGFSK